MDQYTTDSITHQRDCDLSEAQEQRLISRLRRYLAHRHESRNYRAAIAATIAELRQYS